MDNETGREAIRANQDSGTEKSDFVVVLSGDIARFENALNILKKDKADKVIVTAGKTPGKKRETVMVINT